MPTGCRTLQTIQSRRLPRAERQPFNAELSESSAIALLDSDKSAVRRVGVLDVGTSRGGRFAAGAGLVGTIGVHQGSALRTPPPLRIDVIGNPDPGMHSRAVVALAHLSHRTLVLGGCGD